MDHLLPSRPNGAPAPLVVFVVPRWTDRTDREPQGLPFRSFTVAAALLHAGYEVLFFDQEHDLDRVDRFAELAPLLPRAVAAFLWMNEMYPYNQSINSWSIAARLKGMRPDLPVVVGGDLVSVCPPTFFEVERPIDFCIRGYGETSAPALLERLRHGRAPDDVAGLVWRDASGTWRHNPTGTQAELLPEHLALYRLIDLRRYFQMGGLFGNDLHTLKIGTGRGCTKGCSFCVWMKHPSRLLGAEPIVDLMCDLHQRYGITQFHIGELDFFVSKKRVLRMAEMLAERAPDCRWFALGSPVDMVRLTDPEWATLERGGLRKVEMGAESGSSRMLRVIGKPHEAEDSWTASRNMLEHGIVPMNNFLFGYPGERAGDRADTLRLIDRIWRLSPERNCMTFRLFQPMWETPTGDEALSYVENAPADIVEFVSGYLLYDREERRTMPWLPANDERDVKRLVNHYLPLVTSKLVIKDPIDQVLYRALRRYARRRLRTGRYGSQWDRRLYERTVRRRLDVTFAP